MALAFICVVIATVLRSIEGENVCTPRDAIASKLEDAPDAWKFMKSTEDIFYLVYHSRNGTFQKAFPCLHAKRTELTETTPKQATYQYGYSTGGRVKNDHRQVKLDKTDNAYPYDNEFSINMNHVGEALLQDFQLIYTDYQYCVLLRSWNLGYQVWVESVYLKTYRKIPYLCAFLYDLLEPRTKHVVYKWKICLPKNKIENSSDLTTVSRPCSPSEST
uniref:Salivary lipocalin n=1 Tax=Amblyomma maculatum TaxID=34609 RepID=G3MR18_AMBMU